jgi:hypothetical protein
MLPLRRKVASREPTDPPRTGTRERRPGECLASVNSGYIAVRPAARSQTSGAVKPLIRGRMMSRTGEHEPTAGDWASYDTWRESVAVARRERRQRGEAYTGRHRSVPVEPADRHDIAQRAG